MKAQEKLFWNIPDSVYDEPEGWSEEEEEERESYRELHYDEQIEEARIEGWID